MRVHIEPDRCEGHGLCADAAPDVYDLDDDAFVVLKVSGELPEHLQRSAVAGARVCPVAALRIATT